MPNIKRPKKWLGYLLACLPIAIIVYLVIKTTGGEIDSFRLLISALFVLFFGGINFLILWGYFEHYNDKLDVWNKTEAKSMGKKFLEQFPNSFKACKECGGTMSTGVLTCNDCGHQEPIKT